MLQLFNSLIIIYTPNFTQLLRIFLWLGYNDAMNNVIYNNSNEIIGIGNPNSTTQFLLPTPPQLTQSQVSIDDIVTTNGNHWRKIFVIIAKLCCDKLTWQAYRDNYLIDNIYLNFSNKPKLCKKLNIVCGKSHVSTLALDELLLTLTPMDESQRVLGGYLQNDISIISTPYLDYRQFPNALIEEVISHPIMQH